MLAFTPTFTHSQNLILPLAVSSYGAMLRVASLSSSSLGSVTVSGYSGDVTLSLQSNPSWISSSVDPDSPDVINLLYSGAVPGYGVYNMYILAYDGIDKGAYPISVEVREPFYIQEDGADSTQGLFTIKSYDSTFPDIVIRGYGLNDQILSDGVIFIPPDSLPSGLNWITQDQSNLALRVDPSQVSDIQGGLKLFNGSSSSYSILAKAYKSGSMYDTPDRSFNKVFTIQSMSSKVGTQDSALGGYWDDSVSAQCFRLVVDSDTLSGADKPLTYEWSTGGVLGTIVSGGSQSDSTMSWAPNSGQSGTALIQVKVKTGSTVLQTLSINLPCSAPGSWASTNAIKLSSSLVRLSGYHQSLVSFNLSTIPAELSGGDSVAVSFSVMDADGSTSTLVTAPTGFTLTQASPTQSVSIQIPNGMSLGQKLTLVAHASVGGRTGSLYIPIDSLGDKPLQIFGLTTPISQTLGSSIASQSLSVKDITGTAIPNPTIELVGAPPGLYINSSGALAGQVLTTGSYNFKIVANNPGNSPGFVSGVLNVIQGAVLPLSINSPLPEAPIEDDNKQFKLSWSFTGTPSGMTLQKGIDAPIDVRGLTSVSTFISGTSVYTLIGYDFKGTCYAPPVVVRTSSNIVASQLPPASLTIGYLDQNNKMTLNWTPVPVNNSYSLYKGWFLLSSFNQGAPIQILSHGNLPSGMEVPAGTANSRVFSFQYPSNGEVSINMYPASTDKVAIGDGQPWSSYNAFPPVLSDGSFNLDKTSLSKGESLSVSLDSSYAGCDQWRVVYGDGSASAWRPLSVRVDAHSFSNPGNMSVAIEVQNDYQTVKLRRSWSKNVYVLDQDYNPGSLPVDIGLGSIGIGGESGFEISGTSGTIETEPYEVIVKSLVKDEVTQEIKLLVATSRTPDSSSLYGTMALDVFPVHGRPHLKDLVKPSFSMSGDTAALPIAITTSSIPDVIIGKSIQEFPLAAAGGVAPFSWYVSGLPFGAKLSSDGTLSGMVLEAGNFSIAVSVKDSANPPNIDQKTLSFLSKSDLTVASATIPTAKVASTFHSTLQASGGLPPYSWLQVGGSLPRGLSLGLDGMISGTPVSYSRDDFSNPFSFTVEVHDSIGSKASKQLSMNLSQMNLSVGNLDQTILFKGQDFKVSAPVYGGVPPYTLSSFSSPAIQGGMQLINPTQITAVTGQQSVPLTISSEDQSLTFNYSASGTYNVSFNLGVTGGTPGYTFSLDTSDTSKTTLSQAKVSSNGVAQGVVSLTPSSPLSSATLFAKVTDTTGQSVSKLIRISCILVGINGTLFLSGCSVNWNGTGWDAPVILSGSSLPGMVQNKNYDSNYTTPGAALTVGTKRYGVCLVQQPSGQSASVVDLGLPLSFSLSGDSFPNVETSSPIFPGMTLVKQGSVWVFNGYPPSVTTGLGDTGNNTLAISMTGNMTSLGGSSNQTCTGSLTFVVSSGAPVVVNNPFFNMSSKSLSMTYQKRINQDGSVTLLMPGDQQQLIASLVGGGGTPPYVFGVSGMVDLQSALSQGIIINGSGLYFDTKYVSGLSKGSYRIQLSIQDSSNTKVIDVFTINVYETVVSDISIAITSNTLDGVWLSPYEILQSDPSLAYPKMNATGIANWVVSGAPNWLSLNGSPTDYPLWSGSVPAITTPSVVSYTVTATSSVDASKYDRKTYKLKLYNKSVSFQMASSSIRSNTSYTVAGGNTAISVVTFGKDQVARVAILLNNSSVMPSSAFTLQASSVVSNGLGDTPPQYARAVDLILQNVGSYTIYAYDSSNNVLATGNFTVSVSPISVSGTTQKVTIGEYSVVSGLGKFGTNSPGWTGNVSIPNPISISGGTSPFVVAPVSGTSAFSSLTKVDNTQCSYNVSGSNPRAGDTLKGSVTLKATDSTGAFSSGTGQLEVYVQPATSLSVAVLPATWTWAPATNDTFYFNGWTGSGSGIKGTETWRVDAGHAPYTFDVLSLAIPSALSSLLSPSPSNRAISFNNLGSAISNLDLDSDGTTGSSWTVANCAKPAVGKYTISATVKITDSKGLTATVVCPVVLTVPTDTIVADQTTGTKILVYTTSPSSNYPRNMLLGLNLSGGNGVYAASNVVATTSTSGATITNAMISGNDIMVTINKAGTYTVTATITSGAQTLNISKTWNVVDTQMIN